jgi:hypothetical protein
MEPIPYIGGGVNEDLPPSDDETIYGTKASLFHFWKNIRAASNARGKSPSADDNILRAWAKVWYDAAPVKVQRTADSKFICTIIYPL